MKHDPVVGHALMALLQRADLILLPADFVYDWGQRNRLAAPPVSGVLDRQRIDENLVTTVLLGKPPTIDKKQKQRMCLFNENAAQN